jgi:hypothetical protein
MVLLAGQKFSSNVIERIIEAKPELVFPRLHDHHTVIGLINSHFGFFVAKKALKCGRGDFRQSFLRVVSQALETEQTRKSAAKWKDLVEHPST